MANDPATPSLGITQVDRPRVADLERERQRDGAQGPARRIALREQGYRCRRYPYPVGEAVVRAPLGGAPIPWTSAVNVVPSVHAPGVAEQRVRARVGAQRGVVAASGPARAELTDASLVGNDVERAARGLAEQFTPARLAAVQTVVQIRYLIDCMDV